MADDFGKKVVDTINTEAPKVESWLALTMPRWLGLALLLVGMAVGHFLTVHL